MSPPRKASGLAGRSPGKIAASVSPLKVSPPIVSPCFYGIDTPTKKELIGSSHTIQEIRKYITADSLAYLSLEGMLKAAPGSPDQYCNACFTEHYPIPFTKAEELQLGLFEPSL